MPCGISRTPPDHEGDAGVLDPWSSSERREPYKIYRDPVPGWQAGRRSKYPFAEMKVGDCFYIPLKQVNSQNAVASAARQWTKRNSKDWKFVSRVVGDRIGLWRVA